ncbi:MAG: hypothetical protein KY428_11830 [Bacteroidetes bacterium]|nr:hypothetical protein [Bacteroidota bacterium]
MKVNINIGYNASLLVAGLLAIGIAGCSDEFEQELGPRPTGSFTVTPLLGEVNTYVLTSAVEGAFRYQWDTGNGFEEGARTDTVYFADAGDYNVKMRAMTRNGHAIAEETIAVATTDPTSCINTLWGCEGSKTWVLAPEAGALWIGDPGGGTWWSSGEGEPAARPCMFDDEFAFQSDGTFVFNNNGDFWVEEEGGAPHPADIGLSIGCHQESELPEKYQEWGSDTYTFELADGKVKVIGTGAFLGMYKAGDAGTTAGPEESITYEILELTADRLVVRKAYDWGQWRFTFAPKGD